MSNKPNTNVTNNHRAVSFSQCNEEICCPEEKELHPNMSWYSKDELRSLRQEFCQDVVSLSRRIIDGSPRTGQVGMESFSTPDLARYLLRKKREHTRTVLSEQRTQESQGTHDFKKLCSVSQKSSQWSRMRSQALALV